MNHLEDELNYDILVEYGYIFKHCLDIPPLRLLYVSESENRVPLYKPEAFLYISSLTQFLLKNETISQIIFFLVTVVTYMYIRINSNCNDRALNYL